MFREEPNRINRGQMYLANLDPAIGSEQGGNRPVLIIQNDVGNLYSPTVIVAPITAQVKRQQMPTHVSIPPSFGIPDQSIALLEQIRTIDRCRLEDFLGCLDKDVMHNINRAIRISIGLVDVKKPKGRVGEKTTEILSEMVLCLCPACARQFFNTSDHIIQRISSKCANKEPCTYCNVRMGYNYRIIHIRKRLGKSKP